MAEPVAVSGTPLPMAPWAPMAGAWRRPSRHHQCPPGLDL